MRGSLGEISLADLIQVNCLEKKRARLTLRWGERTAELFFDEGEVVHARDGSCEGRDAVFATLTWSGGEFELVPGVSPPARSVDETWSGLLLEGMRRIDEARRDAAGADGAPSSAPPGRPAQAAAESVPLEARAGRLASIQGVAGAFVAAPDGMVLAEAGCEDAHRMAAVAVFLAGAARRLGSALVLDRFECGIVSLPGERLLVMPAGEGRWAGLLVDDHVSTEGLRPEIARVLAATELAELQGEPS